MRTLPRPPRRNPSRWPPLSKHFARFLQESTREHAPGIVSCQELTPEPRQPLESDFHRLVREQFNDFQAVYDRCYARKFGFWRPVIARTVNEFLRCGDLREGFARVRCPDCRHEFFVAFSCKQRCICPSCHQKRALLLGIHIAEDVCEPVAHRQFVWTIPKRLRVFFRFHRHLLHRLPNLAWKTIREVYRAVLERDDLVPGGIITIQTFGQLIHFHPHLHGLVTDGAFTADGGVPSPRPPGFVPRRLDTPAGPRYLIGRTCGTGQHPVCVRNAQAGATHRQAWN